MTYPCTCKPPRPDRHYFGKPHCRVCDRRIDPNHVPTPVHQPVHIVSPDRAREIVRGELKEAPWMSNRELRDAVGCVGKYPHGLGHFVRKVVAPVRDELGIETSHGTRGRLA